MLETAVYGSASAVIPQVAATPQTFTVREILTIFDKEHLSTRKDPRSTRCLIKNHFTPLLDRQFHTLTVIDLVRWSNTIRATSVVQSRAAVKLMRLIYNKCLEWQLYHGENMARRIKIPRPSMRKVYVHEDEMPKTMKAILSQPFPERLYFYMALVMMPRPKELQLAKVADIKLWRDADGQWAGGTWTKPKENMKMNREHAVPLPPKLAEMFAQYLPSLPCGSVYLFPNRNGKPRSKEFWHMRWDDISRAAGIPHIWQYDLRRTGATWANGTSGDLAAVSAGLLGHANFQATKHYVQVMDSPVRKMIEAHEDRLLKAGAL